VDVQSVAANNPYLHHPPPFCHKKVRDLQKTDVYYVKRSNNKIKHRIHTRRIEPILRCIFAIYFTF